jgi:hypothetical protein
MSVKNLTINTLTMKSKILLLFFALLVPATAPSQAVPGTGMVYYVSPSGCDCNDGSRENPFLTIQFAADIMEAGDRCVVLGGDYYESVAPRRSGTATSPLIFTAAPGEKVTISGTEPVTRWTRHSGDIWKAAMDWSMGKNNQVFFDGEMMNEARWPARPFGSNIMDPSGAFLDSADDNGIYHDGFPDSFGKIDDWEGTVIWVMASSKWTSWTRPVKGYDAAGKKVLLDVPDFSMGAMNPARPRSSYLGDHGDEFYLVNNFAFLNQPGQWYYNEDERMLYIIPPEGADPNNHKVTAKRRMVAFDLGGKDFIHVTGFDIHAATINMENSRNCMISDVRARYISHSRGGETSYYLGERSGIHVTGSGNTIRDSEIAFSAEHGILLGGTGNSVINCHIHNINYFGCYGTPVRIQGYKNMVSHNTIHDAGRDGIQSAGLAHLIKHNHVYHVGLIAHDLGMYYTVGNDGGGTEIRHNVFHDNLSEGIQFGLYLDNFTSNYLCHHNVIWGINLSALNLNKPSEYNIVAHNTVFGDLRNWGRWETDGMFGDILVNNLFTGTIFPHADYYLASNLAGISLDTASPADAALSGSRPGLGEGVYLPGITGQYKGTAPDIGAYQSGLPPWRAGHDFSNPPNPVYRLSETPLKNRIYNAGFELVTYIEPPGGDPLAGWQRTDAGNARIIRLSGPGTIETNPDTRNTYNGNGLELPGLGTDGVLQLVTGLEPGTAYVLAGWLKTDGNAEIRLGVRDHGGDEQFANVNGTSWQQPVVEFVTGPGSTSAMVFIQKSGKGTGFADNIGLVPSRK